MACAKPLYRPRDTEHTVLHRVIATHLDGFLRAAAEAGEGNGLPQFIEREFQDFLTCGVSLLAQGRALGRAPSTFRQGR